MFEQIVGQEQAKKTLGAMLETGRIPHALLFAGPWGTGKGEMAFELARMLLCQNGSVSGCSTCAPCMRASRLEHPDLHILFPFRGKPDSSDGEWFEELNRHRLLLGSEPYAPIVYEKGRQIVTYLVGEIQERLSESSLEGGRKVCVILSADRLNARTANALLKTLEEPPEGVHFILTSERVSSVLPTIVSRASVLRFRRLRVSEITEWLGRYPELTAEKRLSCAHLGEGSIKAAKAFAFEHREDIRSLSRDLYEKTALGEADTVVTNAASFLGSRDVLDAEELITGFTLLTRSVMECKCGFITEDAGQAEVIQRLADSTNIDALVRLAAQLEKGLEMLNRNVNISMIMTKLLYEIHDTYR